MRMVEGDVRAGEGRARGAGAEGFHKCGEVHRREATTLRGHYTEGPQH